MTSILSVSGTRLVVKRVRQPGALHLERLDEIPFLPLCTQRKRRGDTIAMSLSAEDITADQGVNP